VKSGRRSPNNVAGSIARRTCSTSFRSDFQPRAKKHLHEIFQAETKEAAEEQVQSFVKEYRDRYAKAVASLVKDEEKLLTFYEVHWMTNRSTNVIGSAFATVKLRQRITKGAGTRTRGLTMAYQLLAMAQQRWRAIRSPHLVQRLLDGTKFLWHLPRFLIHML
jgi:transposase-like protein